jgi:hypothetical protein
LPTATYGFPHLPGLLDACRRPFRATGLCTPWLSVFANHDGLVQGNVPSSLIGDKATGSEKIIDLPVGTDIIQLAMGLQSGDSAALRTLFSGLTRVVTRTPNVARCRGKKRSPNTSTPAAPRSVTATRPRICSRARPITPSTRAESAAWCSTP